MGKQEVVKEENPVETDEDALRVIELVKALDSASEGDGSVMTYVEVSCCHRMIAFSRAH